jgi:hypothetical protein
MVKDKILEAIQQVIVTCELKMVNYEMVSLRSALYECGYTQPQADDVIRYAAKHGFGYCVDSMIAIKDMDDPSIARRPSPDSCYWGPDQLASRLHCLR